MLNKRYRFHSRGGVKYTYSKGKTVRLQKMAMVSTDNTRKKQRIAVVISKKVAHSAVLRNRARRRVYEAIRKNFDRFPKETDYIFIIYSDEILTMPFDELEGILFQLLD